MRHPVSRQARRRGVALPVMLVILTLMLVSGIYLMKSIHSTTLATGNLAYDATLTQSVDLGLHTGFEWLSATAAGNKALLSQDDAAHGYVALLDTSQSARDSGFWTGSQTVAAAGGGTIEYVIHRMCLQRLAFDDAKNQCVQTASTSGQLGTTVAMGTSLASDSPAYTASPYVHYVITARLRGAKGASVTNQMIVLIGA